MSISTPGTYFCSELVFAAYQAAGIQVGSPHADRNTPNDFLVLHDFRLLGYLKGLLIPNPMRWLEIFTRPLSLSFRLFGNVFAGEVLLLVIGMLVPLIVPVPFYFLEIFVGFIQAFVFALLTLVFFKIAVTVHDEPAGAHV